MNRFIKIAIYSLMAVGLLPDLLAQNMAFPDSFNPGASDVVYSMVVQPDGKIVIGGWFYSVAGQSQPGVARLNADGSLDYSFHPGGWGAYTLAVQTDGKILVGGTFTSLGGQPRNYLGRLNTDGTLDATFNPGASGQVNALVVQADGKILVGGSFSLLAGQSRANIGRLNPDGSLDESFNPGASGVVNALALQTDGKILVGGYFSNLGGQSRNNIGRLNAGGSLDTAFNPGAGSTVNLVVVQADGKILVGGGFNTLGGQTRIYLGRLNFDGSLDATFNPVPWSPVTSLTVQTDGRILLGGWFSLLGGQPRNYIGRINADGSLDATFNPVAGSYVYSLAQQDDGKVLVGGSFYTLGGQLRMNIGRLNNTAPATQTLTFDGSTITWLRGGTSPEVWRSTFEICTNGTDWISLVASRIAGGWQLTGLNFPTNATIRVRGFITGGYGSASSWFVESLIARFPVITSQPVSQTNIAGDPATFSVSTIGAAPFGYQWRRGGTNLTDGVAVSGATNSTLTLSEVYGADAGGYSVVITNSFGSVTSLVAVLSVWDPVILSHPASQPINFGKSATLSVTVAGSVPLSYQWRKDGTNVVWAKTDTLTITNVQTTDAGNYDVVITNAFGCLTSEVARITINMATPDDFNPGVSGWSEGESIESFAVQADGKILVGGHFTKLGGQPRANIGRLNPDGSLDVTFNPMPGGNQYGNVSCLAVQADGKILVGGSFTTLGGQARTNIGRLNPDGSLDEPFNPMLGGDQYGEISSIAVQADGKILVGGNFDAFAGHARTNIARLNTDGSVDDIFNPGANNYVESIAVQSDGDILVGGSFTLLGGQSRTNIGRLKPDGSLDTTFNPGVGYSIYSGYNGYVSSIAIQADGKILVGGEFDTLSGQTRNKIGRVKADGNLDATFNPGANAWVATLAIQADGKILAGGNFSMLGGQARAGLGRLNPDGSLDAAFNPGAGTYALSLAVQADGKILVGGGFATLAGVARNCIGRLNNTDAATQNLNSDGSTITWFRGGTSPEAWRTSFEASTNGSDWRYLGAGDRVAGGWEKTVTNLSSQAIIRARAFVTGGNDNGSSWFVESLMARFPVIARQPASQTAIIGTAASFSVSTIGAAPVSYQWRKNGTNLTNGGTVSGVLTAGLSILKVQTNDAGSYSVVITNIYGCVTSSIAVLTVVSPPNLTVAASGTGIPQLHLNGASGIYCDLEKSTNLVNWAFLGRAPGGTILDLNQLDPAWRSFPRGFFRVAMASSQLPLPPTITVHPISVAGTTGGSASFTVAATGSLPLKYQWRLNEVNLTGATNASLTLTGLNPEQSGYYSVVVSNAIGSATSSDAALTFPFEPSPPFTYLTNDDAITITGYTGSGAAVNIPTIITGLPVKSIGEWAFYDCTNLTGITIPGSVNDIGFGAFYGCTGLTNVIIGNHVTSLGAEAFCFCISLPGVTLPSNLNDLGYGAFQGCICLTNIAIPAGVTSIGDSAFGLCTSLLAITVDADNTVYSSVAGVLFDKNQTTLIQYPAGKAGSYIIPGGVINVGLAAFQSSASLTSITIPASVVAIEADAFVSCTSLTMITVDSLNPNYSSAAGVLFNRLQTTLLHFPGGKPGSYTIPVTVNHIGNWAFESCYDLAGIYFQTNAPILGMDVFNGDYNAKVYYLAGTTGWGPTFGGLTARLWNPLVPFNYSTNSGVITITEYIGPDGPATVPSMITGHPVTRVANYAFNSSRSLASITIPNTVTNIGYEALYCTSLTNIDVDVLNPIYSSFAGVLFNHDQTTLIQYPPGRAGSYTVPDGVAAIEEAFAGCLKLTSVLIPATVTAIDTYAFLNCPSLAMVTVNQLNFDYSSAAGVLFDKNQTLLIHYPAGKSGNYTIPFGVTDIGWYAFDSCFSLKEITIPNTVTSIGWGAFENCTGLASLLIPASVADIYGDALLGCTNLTMITVDPANSSFCSKAGILLNQNQTELIHYPAAKAGTSYTIPDSVTSISDYAFYLCTHLTTITVDYSVASIGWGAFDSCANLTGIYFKGDVPNLDSTVIDGDYNATVYYLPGTTGWGPTFGGLPTAPWFQPSPQILNEATSFGVKTNRFGFTIAWATNVPVIVEACTNLSNPLWQPVQTNTLTTGTSYFSDPRWTNYPSRFYRLRSP